MSRTLAREASRNIWKLWTRPPVQCALFHSAQPALPVRWTFHVQRLQSSKIGSGHFTCFSSGYASVAATVEKEAEIAGCVTVVDTAAPRDLVANDQGQKKDFQAAIRNFDGEIIGSAKLLGVIFDTPVRQDIVHEMVRWERAKTRQGTHSVLGRGEVKATGRKPWSQKGTGRARAGDLKAPHHRGGGVAHPKKPRDYSFKLNRKVRRLALMIALSARVAEGRFVLVDRVDNAEGKTTPFRKKLIKLLGVEEPNAMIIEDTISETLERTSFATNNLPKVQVAVANKVSVYELLRHRHVIMTTDALNTMQEKLLTPIRRM